MKPDTSKGKGKNNQDGGREPLRSPFWIRINRDAVSGHDSEPGTLDPHGSDLSEDSSGHREPELRLFGDMVHTALEMGVTTLAFEEHGNVARIRFKVDKTWQTWQTMTGGEGRRRIADIVYHSNHRELPKEPVGMVYMNFKDVDRDWIRIRLNWIFNDAGYQLGLHLEEWPKGFNLDLTALGMYPEELARFSEVLRARRGLILLTSTSRGGKTTLAYAALMYGLMHGRKTATLESERRFHLEQARQVRVQSHQYFADVLAEALQDNPEVLMVDPLIYLEDFFPIMRQAEERLVICCFESGGAVHTLAPFYSTQLGPKSKRRPPQKFMRHHLLSADLMADNLLMIVASRVLPRICPECRELFTIPSGAINRAGLEWKGDQKIQLYRGRGCEACGGIGLQGHSGIYEVLQVTPAIRQWLYKFADAQEKWGGRVSDEASDSVEKQRFFARLTHNLRSISVAMRREGMRGLREVGLCKALDGITRMCDVVNEAPLPLDRINRKPVDQDP